MVVGLQSRRAMSQTSINKPLRISLRSAPRCPTIRPTDNDEPTRTFSLSEGPQWLGH